MASRDSNAAKLTPSKSPRTRNASAAAAAAARTPPPHPSKTPNAKTPTPKKRSGGAAKADDDNEPPKPVVSRNSNGVDRLQAIMRRLPTPCDEYTIRYPIGEGTFSTVYLAERRLPGANGDECERIAVKHLVPTTSPERIWMELDCLRVANGRDNVIPLLFGHRLDGDVILAMPFIHTIRFGELIKDITMSEAKCYMGGLLRALAYVHSHGIIHRDVKPANFLFDRRHRKFALVDFGLAQRTDEPPPEKKMSPPNCKRKFSSSDLADSQQSSPAKRARAALVNITDEELNAKVKRQRGQSRHGQQRGQLSDEEEERKTPDEKLLCTLAQPSWAYYDSRGNMAREDVRGTAKSLREIKQEREAELERNRNRGRNGEQSLLPARVTPKKKLTIQRLTEPPRRSPRKHASSKTSHFADAPQSRGGGFATMKITGNAIVTPGAGPSGAAHRTPLSKTSSFTMLDPTSFGDYTPRLRASVTSRTNNSQAAGLPMSAAQISKNVQMPWSMTSRVAQQAAAASMTPSMYERAKCHCYGKPLLCNRCSKERPHQKAPRAGTPGFRPPEVLLKSAKQNTAVDLWAAGIVFLCMLARSYPFFRAHDDNHALAEIMVLVGTDAVTAAASQYGKKFITSERCPGVDLGELCKVLSAKGRGAEQEPLAHDPAAVDLMEKMLALFHQERITAEQALNHRFFH